MRLLRAIAVSACLAFLCWELPVAAQTIGYGKLTGVVVDLAGTQQMGVSIWLSPETASGRAPAQLLTNQNGVFESARLRPGLYSVRATRSGFLPTIQQHVRVTANLTTLLRIELDSVFSSLDQLRRQPAQPSESDDWKWVLRTSAASRPVLQLVDGTLVMSSRESNDAGSLQRRTRARVEMSNGSIHPGSPSALPGSLGTSVSFNQTLGPAGLLLVAGQMGYEPASDAAGLTGGLASIWLPSGQWGAGPKTSVILRQAQDTPTSGGQSVRVMRVEHSEQIAFNDRLMLDYAGELAMGGVGAMTYKVRPRAQLTWRFSPSWSAAFLLQTDPESNGLETVGKPLESAIEALGTTPVLIWRDGHLSSLEGGWHKEISVRRTLGNRGSIEAAAFHDFSGHQAVFGFDAPQSGIATNRLLWVYAHDAGPGGSLGTRVALREKLSNHVDVAAIYSWAGVLAPGADGVVPPSDSNLHDLLQMRYRHSLAARVSGKIVSTGTQFSASYKWLSGVAVSRQDLFGESALGVDPYLSLTVRQPLPSFHTGGHWEAMADFRNVLSQGYVSLTTPDGRLLLMPVERSFQGGVSFQF